MNASLPAPPRTLMAVDLDVHGTVVRAVSDSAVLVQTIVAQFGPMVTGAGEEGDDGRADIRVYTDDDPSGAALGPLWQSFSMQLVDAVAHRFLFVHACAVETDAGAVLCAGPGRSGKTTLALAAARMGKRIVGDDVVAVEWSTGRVYQVPFFIRPRADTHAAVDFGRMTDSRRPGYPSGSAGSRIARVALLGAGRNESAIGFLCRCVHRGTMPSTVRVARVLKACAGADIGWMSSLPPVADGLPAQRAVLEDVLDMGRPWRGRRGHAATGFVTVLQGFSMMPSLRPGDRIQWRTLTPNDVPAAGDIVGYIRDGRLVAHRVVAVAGETIRVRGDANIASEGGIVVAGIVGRAEKVRRGAASMDVPRLTSFARAVGVLAGLCLGVAWRVRHRSHRRHSGISGMATENPRHLWALRREQYRRALADLDAEFRALGVHYMPIKGACLLCNGVADRLPVRKMADIDLLVLPDDFAAAVEHFDGRDGVMPLRGTWPFEREYHVDRQGRTYRLELHCMLNYPERFNLPAGTLFGRGTRGGDGLRVLPDAVDTLLVHVCHALVHVGQGLDVGQFAEAGLIAELPGFCWEEYWRRAEQAGVGGFSMLYLGYVSRHTGMDVGEAGRVHRYAAAVSRHMRLGRMNRLPQLVRRLLCEVPFVRRPLGLGRQGLRARVRSHAP